MQESAAGGRDLKTHRDERLRNDAASVHPAVVLQRLNAPRDSRERMRILGKHGAHGQISRRPKHA